LGALDLELGLVGIGVVTPAPGVAEFHAHVLIGRIKNPTVATAVLELYRDILVHEESQDAADERSLGLFGVGHLSLLFSLSFLIFQISPLTAAAILELSKESQCHKRCAMCFKFACCCTSTTQVYSTLVHGSLMRPNRCARIFVAAKAHD
jgi:hypothetical protein